MSAERGEIPEESAVLNWPPCECGRPLCPDAKARVDDRSHTETIERLRPLVQRENQRWGWGGGDDDN